VITDELGGKLLGEHNADAIGKRDPAPGFMPADTLPKNAGSYRDARSRRLCKARQWPPARFEDRNGAGPIVDFAQIEGMSITSGGGVGK